MLSLRIAVDITEAPLAFARTVSCIVCATENHDSLLACNACSQALDTTRFAEGSIERHARGTPVPGALFAGRYQILSALGRGGTGSVFRARDHMLGDEVALKLLVGPRSASHLEQFIREITAARKITHENVMRVYDLGLFGDSVFLTMELVTGGTLADWLAEHKGHPPLDRAIEIAVGLCCGLEAAHKKGVIHSDIKPANALITADGRALLADFGIAQLFQDPRIKKQQVTGTPLYMSPEQFHGEPLSVSSDIYSLGVLLYELFTGETPFAGGDLLQLAYRHARETPVPPTAKHPELPLAIDTIVLRALAKDPKDRYSSAAEVAEALADVFCRRMLSRAARMTTLLVRRKRRRLLVPAAVLALLGSLGGFLLNQSSPTDPPTASSASIADPACTPDSGPATKELGWPPERRGP